MIEFKEHKVYEMLNNVYKEIPLDYVILLSEEYKGVETHKKQLSKLLKFLIQELLLEIITILM